MSEPQLQPSVFRQVFVIQLDASLPINTEEEFNELATKLTATVEGFLESGERILCLSPGITLHTEMLIESEDEAKARVERVEKKGPLIRPRR